MNTSFVCKLPAYRTKADQKVRPSFLPQRRHPQPIKELLLRVLDTKLWQANIRVKKIGKPV